MANLDPRRGEHHATVLSKIKLDAVALGVLADQGYTPDSVAARRARSCSFAATATSAPAARPSTSPSGFIRKWRPAPWKRPQVIGLDIAGVDVVATDISRPLEEQGGVIVEVNAAPGLRMHLEPSVGISRPVGEAIVDTLFPEGDEGRIPVCAVTGVNGKTTTTRFIAHMLKRRGLRVGMTCTDGIFIDGRRIDNGDCSGPKSAARC